MYFNQNPRPFSNYDVNLTTATITWGSNSVIYDVFTFDVNFESVISSTLNVFIELWGTCFKFWLSPC